MTSRTRRTAAAVLLALAVAAPTQAVAVPCGADCETDPVADATLTDRAGDVRTYRRVDGKRVANPADAAGTDIRRVRFTALQAERDGASVEALRVTLRAAGALERRTGATWGFYVRRTFYTVSLTRSGAAEVQRWDADEPSTVAVPWTETAVGVRSLAVTVPVSVFRGDVARRPFATLMRETSRRFSYDRTRESVTPVALRP